MKFFKRLVNSLDNTNQGFSARKLTAFIIIASVIVGHFFYYKHCYTKEDFSIFTSVLIIDYCASGFFLGIITFQQIINFKNGNSTKQQESV
jgi:hypothetical protein